MCDPNWCANATRDGDKLDDWIEGPCGTNPGKLLAEHATAIAEARASAALDAWQAAIMGSDDPIPAVRKFYFACKEAAGQTKGESDVAD